jgi:hypothetical protein
VHAIGVGLVIISSPWSISGYGLARYGVAARLPPSQESIVLAARKSTRARYHFIKVQKACGKRRSSRPRRSLRRDTAPFATQYGPGRPTAASIREHKAAGGGQLARNVSSRAAVHRISRQTPAILL